MAEQICLAVQISALKAIVPNESGLQRMQCFAVGRPSIVVMGCPSCITASVKQELMRRPSNSAVQASHWPWSQPFLEPVSARCSRGASSRVVWGSTLWTWGDR